MTLAMHDIITSDDPILVTGASGFIGTRVLGSLLAHGFRKVRCLVRPSRDRKEIEALIRRHHATALPEVITGNLLSREDCLRATQDVAVIYHLAVGAGGRSFPDAFLNAVVTTRNLVEASLQQRCLRRFVNISSLAAYTNRRKPRRGLLDESCQVEDQPQLRDAYCYAKVKQDELVMDYGKNQKLPYVILRPGVVYGPGKNAISGRVGIGTFGIFLHLGGPNLVPLTYVDNCAEAIVLAGLKHGVDGEVFNVVDDDLPSSRRFLRLYKTHVRPFRSIYLHRFLSFMLCYLWEKGAAWSCGQLPQFLNRRVWHAHWRGSVYTNDKLKRMLGWTPHVATDEGLSRYFDSCRDGGAGA
jgi:nucleoside-diphosphate-sugar epimerase